MYLSDTIPDYSSILPPGETPEQALIAGDITSAEFKVIKLGLPLSSLETITKPGLQYGEVAPTPPVTPEQKLKAGLITPAQFTAAKMGLPSIVTPTDIFNTSFMNPILDTVATPVEKAVSSVVTSINPFSGITSTIGSYGTYIVIGLAALGGLAIFSKIRK